MPSTLPSWVKAGIAIDAVVGIALLAGAALVVRRIIRDRKSPQE